MPAALLSSMDIHVVGSPSDDVSDESSRYAHMGPCRSIRCAVPFLRDRDIRTSAVLESLDDKNEALSAAIAAHYREVAQAVEQMMPAEGNPPVVAMATCSSRARNRGGGARLVCRIACPGTRLGLSPLFDYVALGHLHRGNRLEAARESAIRVLRCRWGSTTDLFIPTSCGRYPKGALGSHRHADRPCRSSWPMRRISGTVQDIECELRPEWQLDTPVGGSRARRTRHRVRPQTTHRCSRGR
jgi:hypothetical protein